MSADGRSNARSVPAPTSGTPKPCACGCGQPAKPGGRFASGACRARAHDREHPRVDLSSVPEGRREAVLGVVKVLVESRLSKPTRPDRHRPRHRIYLDEHGGVWGLLETMARERGKTKADIVREALVAKWWKHEEEHPRP